MLNRALIAIVTAAWAWTAHAAGPPLPSFEVMERLNPTDPLPERETRWDRPGVTLTALTYGTIPGYRPLRLDLYRAASAQGPRPLVLFVHGGGWTFGNPRAGAAFRDFSAILAGLAERGYAVASIEYRLSREATFPAQRDDVARALEYLRGNATKLGIDPARIVLWGMSAGAHLGALNAVTCAPQHCVQGFVGWFGVYDLAAYLEEAKGSTNSRTMLGCDAAPCAPATIAAANPIAHAHKDAPPMLLVHGLVDDTVRPSQSRTFAQQLRAVGAAVDLVEVPDADHGMIGTDAAATRSALQQALGATFDFFDRVLRPVR